MLRSTRSAARDHTARGRRALAASLVLATIHALLPPPARAGEAVVTAQAFVFRDDDRIHHVDVSELVGLWAAMGSGSGEASLTLSVLRPDPGDPAPLAWPPLMVEAGHDLDAVVPLRPHETVGLLDAVGRPLHPLAWDDVVTWSVAAGPTSVVSTLAAGEDEVAGEIARSCFDPEVPLPPAEGWVELSVNGVGATIHADELRELRARLESGEAIDPETVPASLAALGDAFRDLPGFVNRVHRLYLADARLRGGVLAVGLSSDGGESRCTALCLSCAGTLLLSIGAYVALIASCGGALVSGGATALACIAAFVGVQGSHFAMLGACGRCYACHDGPPE